MASPSQLRYIAQQASARGLDPAAVLAIASHEGLSGAVGDHGTSFGPWQLHEGGALPSGIANPQAWAWSPQGIGYALDRMAGVARGLKGARAISAISTQFERPANPGAEIADASAHYNEFAGIGGGGGINPSPGRVSAGGVTASPSLGTGNQNQLAAMLMAAQGGGVDFNSNQVQAPNLIGLAQLRQQLSATGGYTNVPQTMTAASGGKTTGRVSGNFKVGDPVVAGTSIGGLHPTEGLAGYPAHDYFAPSGSGVVAPISGKVVRLSGHDPAEGPIEGPHGPLGWSVYIQGNDGHTYYLTHMGSRNVRVGETVKAGQPIGTVADYARYGTPSHIHMGVH